MDKLAIERVQNSWAAVEPVKADAADLFYEKLFKLDPTLRSLFKNDLAAQKVKLMDMIGAAVAMLNRMDDLVAVLVRLGERHIAYGIKPDDYDTVGTALLDTLSAELGDAFTPDVELAWTEAYSVMKSTMLIAEESVAELSK